MESENEFISRTTTEITEAAKISAVNFLPSKLREKYEAKYRRLMEYRVKSAIYFSACN